MTTIDYVHWDDPNKLVDHLRLLDASHQTGNNVHDNEMLSIIEELREASLIKSRIDETNQSSGVSEKKYFFSCTLCITCQ